MPRGPSPIKPEPCPMPPRNRLRQDENRRLLPSTPEISQFHSEELVGAIKSRLRISSLQDSKLLPKHQIFQEQLRLERKNWTASTEEYSINAT